MPFIFYNPNPQKEQKKDCMIRAISKAINKDWEEVYIGLCCEGLETYETPEAVWSSYLKKHGFEEKNVRCICPRCVTVERFAEKHPEGRYVVATSRNNIVAIEDGDYYDTEDSGDEIVIYYFKKGR